RSARTATWATAERTRTNAIPTTASVHNNPILVPCTPIRVATRHIRRGCTWRESVGWHLRYLVHMGPSVKDAISAYGQFLVFGIGKIEHLMPFDPRLLDP